MNQNDVILLLSGGIDSTTLLAQLRSEGKSVHALSFNYGQKHKAELEFARSNALRYGVSNHIFFKIDFEPMAHASSLTNMELQPGHYLKSLLPKSPTDVYVPGRNLLMLSFAASFAEANGLSDIFIAANKDDSQLFPDCRPSFFSSINSMWNTIPTTKNLRVNTPFIQLSKRDVLLKGKELNINLQQTLSCYNPIENNACGKCLSCRVRAEAIASL